MKKKFIFLSMTVLIFIILFTGCCNHIWKNATCEKPKTCTQCGEEQGEALGHTTVWGICDMCNNPVAEHKSAFLKITDQIDNAVKMVGEADMELNDYTDIELYLYYYNKCYKYLNYAIDYCGDYLEFEELKSYLQECSDILFNTISSDIPKDSTAQKYFALDLLRQNLKFLDKFEEAVKYYYDFIDFM